MSEFSVEELEKITRKLTNRFSPLGFEFHPFKIAWYNQKVLKAFHLKYCDDAVGYVILSTPSMFEKAFKPFLKHHFNESETRDPLDQCMSFHFTQMKQDFPENDVISYQDFEMTPTRRPKILMQTAGHVAGAAYFYQRADIINNPWNNKSEKINGVSLHPKYGGWFGFRGVLIFRDVKCPSVEPRFPVDVLPGDEQRIDLLEKFNFHWQDWRYRDVIPVEERYSEEQKSFFATRPAERIALIEIWKKQWD